MSNQAANPNKRSEQAHVKAGRDGEDFVRSKLEPLGVVRSAVRIPGESHGRREIDLILQTRTHIYLFEVCYVPYVLATRPRSTPVSPVSRLPVI